LLLQAFNHGDFVFRIAKPSIVIVQSEPAPGRFGYLDDLADALGFSLMRCSCSAGVFVGLPEPITHN
jgi:hypothetical protein